MLKDVAASTFMRIQAGYWLLWLISAAGRQMSGVSSTVHAHTWMVTVGYGPCAHVVLRTTDGTQSSLSWMHAGGYTLQAIGLEYTTASRGAFTGTFTVLAVPILVGLSGRKVPWTTWAAAAVALTGVLTPRLLGVPAILFCLEFGCARPRHFPHPRW